MGSVRPAGRGRFSPFAAFQPNARLLIAAVFLDGMAVSFFQLFFNFFILAKGFGIGFLGLANSMAAVAALALGVFLGRFSDRVGFRVSMPLGIAVAYSALVVALQTSSPAVLLGAMALQGAGGMLFYLGESPFLMKHSGPRERSLLFSVNVGMQILSGAAGSLIAGQLPAGLQSLWNIPPGSALSYQIILLAGTFCGLLALVPLLLARASPPAEVPPAPERPESAAWTREEKLSILRMVTPNFMIGCGAALLIPYLNLFFRQRFSVPDSLLGGMFSLSAVITGLATLGSPWLASRLGSKIRTVMATQAGSLLFLLILGFSPSFAPAGIAFFFRAGLMNMSVPLYAAFCMERTPEARRGVVSSLIQMAWQAGWAVGPSVSGFVQDRWGFTPLFVATSVFYAAAILALWRFFLPMEKDHPAATAAADNLS
jgi:MFS family permease